MTGTQKFMRKSHWKITIFSGFFFQDNLEQAWKKCVLAKVSLKHCCGTIVDGMIGV